MRKTIFIIIAVLVVTHMVAQDGLVPTSSETGVATDLIPKYPAFVYTVAPSFDAGYVLACTREPIEFVLIKAEENTWYHPDAKLKTYRMPVADSVAQIINSLIASAVNTASYMNEFLGEDGDFFIFKTGSHSAYCWSPGAGRCIELVSVMNACCRCVENKSEDNLVLLMPQCRALLREFHKDYPMYLFSVQKHTSWKYDEKAVAQYTVTAESFNIQIAWRGTDRNNLEELREEYLNKHEQEFVDYVRKNFVNELADFPYFDLWSYPRIVIFPDEKNNVDFTNPNIIPWNTFCDMD